MRKVRYFRCVFGLAFGLFVCLFFCVVRRTVLQSESESENAQVPRPDVAVWETAPVSMGTYTEDCPTARESAQVIS